MEGYVLSTDEDVQEVYLHAHGIKDIKLMTNCTHLHRLL